jgi:hypothetical protein
MMGPCGINVRSWKKTSELNVDIKSWDTATGYAVTLHGGVSTQREILALLFIRERCYIYQAGHVYPFRENDKGRRGRQYTSKCSSSAECGQSMVNLV